MSKKEKTLWIIGIIIWLASIFLTIKANAQRPYAEAQFGFTTRLTAMAVADGGVVSYNERWNYAATYSYEFGNLIPSYGGHIGYVIRLNEYYEEDLTIYGGAAYTVNCGDKLEGSDVLMSIVGVRYNMGRGSFHLRYQGGTISGLFGYRFGGN